MFYEVELRRHVAIRAENLDRNGMVSQRLIATDLLKNLLIEKASKDYGYLLTVTSLKSIIKVEVAESAHMYFCVGFKCHTFMPLAGEIFEGVVHRVYRHGVILKCGPIKCAFLSARKMPDYHYVPGVNPYFTNIELSRIENDVVVRFVVLDVRWIVDAHQYFLGALIYLPVWKVSSLDLFPCQVLRNPTCK